MRRNARELDGRIVLRANRIRAHELTSGSRSPPPRRSEFCSLWIQSRSCAAPQAAGATRLDSQFSNRKTRDHYSSDCLLCCRQCSRPRLLYCTVQYWGNLMRLVLFSSRSRVAAARSVSCERPASRLATHSCKFNQSARRPPTCSSTLRAILFYATLLLPREMLRRLERYPYGTDLPVGGESLLHRSFETYLLT